MGAWVSGFGFHSSTLVVFPIKEKAKIKHCLQQAILEEHRLKTLQYLLLCLLSFILVPGEGRQPFTHMWKLLSEHLLRRKD